MEINEYVEVSTEQLEKDVAQWMQDELDGLLTAADEEQYIRAMLELKRRTDALEAAGVRER